MTQSTVGTGPTSTAEVSASAWVSESSAANRLKVSAADGSFDSQTSTCSARSGGRLPSKKSRRVRSSGIKTGADMTHLGSEANEGAFVQGQRDPYLGALRSGIVEKTRGASPYFPESRRFFRFTPAARPAPGGAG